MAVKSVKSVAYHLGMIMAVSLQFVPSAAQTQEMELARIIGLGDLLHADQADAFERLRTFYPNLRNVPTKPLHEGRFGDQYFDLFMANTTRDEINQLKCRRFGDDAQRAILQGNHPLEPVFWDYPTGELQDVGEYDVIMDCEFALKPNTLGVPELINYFSLTGYDVDVVISPEMAGRSTSESSHYELNFESADQSWTGPNIIRGDLLMNEMVQILTIRFGYLPELLS